MTAAGAGRPGAGGHLALLYPALLLGLFFVVPFAIMAALSFFHRVEGAFYEPAFELDNYARLGAGVVPRILAFSLILCGAAALICVSVAVPFTYSLTRLSRRRQTVWLVFILAVLSLSEVIVGFAWSMLLSRSAGLGSWLFALGLADRPQAFTPGLVALLLGLCFIAFPYSVLVLFPAASRLEPELTEAARTLGASPLRSFFTVVLPSLLGPIIATLILAFVFTLGSYLLPQLLGRPEHWTVSVLITDQAIFQSNLPFAAAIAITLMVVSLALVGVVFWLGRRAGPRAAA